MCICRTKVTKKQVQNKKKPFSFVMPSASNYLVRKIVNLNLSFFTDYY